MKHLSLFENFNNNEYDKIIKYLKDYFKNIKIKDLSNKNKIVFTVFEDSVFTYFIDSKELYKVHYDLKIKYNKKIEPYQIYDTIMNGDYLNWVEIK